MPATSARQGEPIGDRLHTPFARDEGCLPAHVNPDDRRFRLLPVLLFLLWWTLWPAPTPAQTADEERAFDIGIVIDNRPLPRTADARADVNALIALIDRHMFIENVMVFERPTIEVICDVFGCPADIEPESPFPPLLWQITRREKARIVVYYIGDGRAEGLERQLLFLRSDGAVVGLSVDWLHAMIEEAEPDFAAMLLDTAFAPRPLPCASEDPRLISDALLDFRRNYLRIARDRWTRSGNIELSATTPVQPAHCDRFDLVLASIQQPMFTKFFLKGVIDVEADREPFGDDDGLITHGELADYLNDRISRAARFQWGRRQNVRAIGPRSRGLASVDPRDLSEENEDLIERRNRAPAAAPGPVPDGLPDGPVDDPNDASDADLLTRPDETEPRCDEDPTADDCHPCMRNPGGAACAERCLEESDSDLCARFSAPSTDPGADMADSGEGAPAGIEAVPLDEENDGPSAACAFASDNVAPYASALLRSVRGDIEPSCAWAADRSEVELGPFAQIFTPIAWRLGRESVQDLVHCLLDCDGIAMIDEGRAEETLTPTPAIEEASVVRRPVDPRTLGGFNRHVCDRLHEPLPPYIGIPRWMPGTLAVSEALRVGYGCPPPAAEPALPTPLAVAIARPPESETPDGRSPAVAGVEDRLATWPPYAAGVDLPPDQDETPSPTIAPEVETADATPTPDGDGAASPPEMLFVPTVSRVHWLQSALTVDNRNPGPIDGALGPRTMAAIQSWRQDHQRGDRTGALTETEFQEIIEAFGRRFKQVQARVDAF